MGEKLLSMRASIIQLGLLKRLMRFLAFVFLMFCLGEGHNSDTRTFFLIAAEFDVKEPSHVHLKFLPDQHFVFKCRTLVWTHIC